MLGFAGLAAGEPLSRWLRPRRSLSSVAVAWLLTLVRFLLEKSAAPGAARRSRRRDVDGARRRRLPRALPRRPSGGLARARGRSAAYAFLVRGFVALSASLATLHGLGTHYDVSGITTVALAPTGISWRVRARLAWPQLLWLTLLPQLVVWPALTVLAGLAGALAGGFRVVSADAAPQGARGRGLEGGP